MARTKTTAKKSVKQPRGKVVSVPRAPARNPPNASGGVKKSRSKPGTVAIR